MTDAKELLTQINALATTFYDCAETQIDYQAELLLRARAWIERWAPVVEAEKALHCLKDSGAYYGESLAALVALERAVEAALGEDKP